MLKKTADDNKDRYIEKMENTIKQLRDQIALLYEELDRDRGRVTWWKYQAFAEKDRAMHAHQKISVLNQQLSALQAVSNGRLTMMRQLADARNDATRKYHEAFEQAVNRQRDVEFLIRRFRPVVESLV